MKWRFNIKTFNRIWAIVLTTTLVSSCDLMHDNRDNCPEGLYINFVYDYNTLRADLFKDHVGEVTAYIFDKEGYFVKSQTESNTSGYTPLAEWGYQMQITDLVPGDYQVVALCQQKPAHETALQPGAKYNVSDIQVGDSLSRLFTSVKREGWTTTNYPDIDEQVSGYLINNQSAPMDTLWHGMKLTPTSLSYGQPNYATISLMRNTNKLHISLRQVSDGEAHKTDISDYDIYIKDNNDSLKYDNSIVSQESVLYTPYAKWNTQDLPVTRAEDESTPKTAHAELNFNRLIHRNVGNNPAILYIYNNKTNSQVAKIHLSDILQQGRGAYEYYNYSIQEFLDREFSYSLSFYLVGDKWQYVNLSISVLPWVKRIQNADI